MGTIYMKANMADITPANIGQFNVNSMDSSEMEEICRKAGMREVLVTMNISRSFQYNLHCLRTLTLEECMGIIVNSHDVWDDIGCIHDFSTEFLMEHGDKLSRINIERQRNITPEFVRIHQDRLSMRRIIEARERIGDIADFLVTREMCEHYLRNQVSWNSTKENVLKIVDQCDTPPEVRERVVQFLNSWYDTPIDREKLLNDYSDQRRASYSESVVRDYWNSNSKKAKYDDWNDYAEECKRTGADGLADTWYRSFCRNPLLEILGYND